MRVLAIRIEDALNLTVQCSHGGLFAPDPIADELVIPDPLATDLADLAKWDYRCEVPVTVLGHIFEQLISDIQKLKSKKLGQALLVGASSLRLLRSV
jgi:hypothetical protein